MKIKARAIRCKCGGQPCLLADLDHSRPYIQICCNDCNRQTRIHGTVKGAINSWIKLNR